MKKVLLKVAGSRNGSISNRSLNHKGNVPVILGLAWISPAWFIKVGEGIVAVALELIGMIQMMSRKAVRRIRNAFGSEQTESSNNGSKSSDKKALPVNQGVRAEVRSKSGINVENIFGSFLRNLWKEFKELSKRTVKVVSLRSEYRSVSSHVDVTTGVRVADAKALAAEIAEVIASSKVLGVWPVAVEALDSRNNVLEFDLSIDQVQSIAAKLREVIEYRSGMEVSVIKIVAGDVANDGKVAEITLNKVLGVWLVDETVRKAKDESIGSSENEVGRFVRIDLTKVLGVRFVEESANANNDSGRTSSNREEDKKKPSEMPGVFPSGNDSGISPLKSNAHNAIIPSLSTITSRIVAFLMSVAGMVSILSILENILRPRDQPSKQAINKQINRTQTQKPGYAHC